VPLLDTGEWVNTSFLYYDELMTKFIDSLWEIVDWDKINERYIAARDSNEYV